MKIEAFTPSSDQLERYRRVFGADAGLYAQTFTECEYSRPLS
jgi:hypothetical protein